MDIAKFCEAWNKLRDQRFPNILPCELARLFRQHVSFSQLERPRVMKNYTRMFPVWRALWRATPDLEPKKKFALFLSFRASIQAVELPIVSEIKDQAWCWYHTKTPGFREVHVEAKILTDRRGRSLHGRYTLPMIYSELLTIIDLEDDLEIDEVSSEQEWRRGLHSERSQIRNC